MQRSENFAEMIRNGLPPQQIMINGYRFALIKDRYWSVEDFSNYKTSAKQSLRETFRELTSIPDFIVSYDRFCVKVHLFKSLDPQFLKNISIPGDLVKLCPDLTSVIFIDGHKFERLEIRMNHLKKDIYANKEDKNITGNLNDKAKGRTDDPSNYFYAAQKYGIYCYIDTEHLQNENFRFLMNKLITYVQPELQIPLNVNTNVEETMQKNAMESNSIPNDYFKPIELPRDFFEDITLSNEQNPNQLKLENVRKSPVNENSIEMSVLPEQIEIYNLRFALVNGKYWSISHFKEFEKSLLGRIKKIFDNLKNQIVYQNNHRFCISVEGFKLLYSKSSDTVVTIPHDQKKIFANLTDVIVIEDHKLERIKIKGKEIYGCKDLHDEKLNNTHCINNLNNKLRLRTNENHNYLQHTNASHYGVHMYMDAIYLQDEAFRFLTADLITYIQPDARENFNFSADEDKIILQILNAAMQSKEADNSENIADQHISQSATVFTPAISSSLPSAFTLTLAKKGGGPEKIKFIKMIDKNGVYFETDQAYLVLSFKQHPLMEKLNSTDFRRKYMEDKYILTERGFKNNINFWTEAKCIQLESATEIQANRNVNEVNISNCEEQQQRKKQKSYK